MMAAHPAVRPIPPQSPTTHFQCRHGHIHDTHEIEELKLHYHLLLNQRRVPGGGFPSLAACQKMGHVEEPRRPHQPSSMPITSRLQGRIKLPPPSPPPVVIWDRLSPGQPAHRRSPHHTSSMPIASRLQGRIKLPPLPPAVIWDRLSPGQPTHRRSLRDRINPAAVPADVGNRKRSDFPGPKSLAELQKGGENVAENNKQRHLPSISSSGGGAGADITVFDGPMPLSLILKRKREAQAGAPTFSRNTCDEDGPKKKLKEALLGGSSPATAAPAAEALGAAVYSPPPPPPPSPKEIANQECQPIEDSGDAGADHSPEAQQVEDDSDYQHLDAIDQLDDDFIGGEAADLVDEEFFDDDEDEDAFAKRMGVFPT